MINSYFSAKLIDFNTIKVFIFSDVQKPANLPIKLITDLDNYEDLIIVKQTFLKGLELYECRTKNRVTLGNDYRVSIESFGVVPLIMDDITSFQDFDSYYNYEGDDLGFTYSKEKTTWKIWAPIASKVVLLIRDENNEFVTFKMNRGDKGVYDITLEGDFNGRSYRYLITNNGLTNQTTDPYAKASTANGKNSVVVDFNSIKIDMHDDNLPFYKNYVDTIIYELNVRDFTIDKDGGFKNRGKYLGLTEKGLKTKNGHPVGIDYIKDLGVTHVQLLPIYDFKTIDELHPENSYNWGYDPAQYFVPEGSYSLDPEDPYSRIIECKEMISAFHKEGIKVNMDVVYNHVYQFDHSVFEAVVPNYYFRKSRNGLLSTASGCGNELDTSRPMVRKLIIDSCRHWIEFYDIDGFRFDLMGLIDIDTINKVLALGRSYKKDFMIYGEGWNMDSSLPENQRAAIINSFKMPEVAFFNDSFRDIVKGPGGFEGRGKECGYLLGNKSYKEGFKFVLLGSCVNYCFPKRFLSANQSINYVECHDNSTLYDKIKNSIQGITEEDAFRIINSTNATIAVACGIPFYHAGQEIASTKFGEDNTYNKGDEYNMFRWSIVDSRYDMVMYLKSVIKFRKTLNCYYDSIDIEKNNYFINYDNDALGFSVKANSADGKSEYLYLFNPNKANQRIEFEDYYNVIIALAGYLRNSDVFILNDQLKGYQFEGLLKKVQ